MTTYRVWSPDDCMAWGLTDVDNAYRMADILRRDCRDTYACEGCDGIDPCFSVQEVEDEIDETDRPHYGIWGNCSTLAEWEEQFNGKG